MENITFNGHTLRWECPTCKTENENDAAWEYLRDNIEIEKFITEEVCKNCGLEYKITLYGNVTWEVKDYCMVRKERF